MNPRRHEFYSVITMVSAHSTFCRKLVSIFSANRFRYIFLYHDLFTDVHVISDLLEAWMSIDFWDTLSKGFGRDFGSLWLALGFHLTPVGSFLSLPHCFVRSPLASFTHFEPQAPHTGRGPPDTRSRVLYSSFVAP